jgi:homopolymeric O-antigen transport system permease protein
MLAALRNATTEVWDHRDLLEQLALRDIKLRYKQAAMGFMWAVFMPCLIVLSGLIIRYAMARIAGQSLVPADIANIAVKGVGWAFFVGALGFATASLVGNSSLVTKIYFPREVLPLSSVIAQSFDTTIGLGTLLVLLPFLGVRAHASLVWVPVLLALLVLFTTAASLFLSCANLFYRDVKYIVQIVLMFGIFFTPVFFEPSMLGARGAHFAMLNPMTGILEGLRISIVTGQGLSHPITTLVHGVETPMWEPWELVYSAIWAVGGLLGATAMFRRLQPLFAEFI